MCLLFLKISFRMPIYAILQHVFITNGVLMNPTRVNTRAKGACSAFYWPLTWLGICARSVSDERVCVSDWRTGRCRFAHTRLRDFWLVTYWPMRLSLCHPAGAKCLNHIFLQKNIKIFHTLYIFTCIREIFKSRYLFGSLWKASVLSRNNVLWKNANLFFSSCKTHRWNRPD